MVHKNCFITDCYSKSDQENGRVSFFQAPKKFFKDWEEKIPKKGFTATSRICSRHFDEEDIIKGKMIGGVFYAQQVWRLKCGALPKHFLDTSSIRDKHLPSLTNNQVAPVREKLLKRRCKTIQSILAKAGHASASDGDSFPCTSLHSKDPPATPNDDDAPSVTPIILSVKDGIEESLISTAMEPSYNDIDMADSPVESNQLDTEAKSGVESSDRSHGDGTPIAILLPVSSVKCSGESMLISKATEPTHKDKDMAHSSVNSQLTDTEAESVKESTNGFRGDPIDEAFFQEIKARVKLPGDSWHWIYKEKSKEVVCISWESTSDGITSMKAFCIHSTNSVSFFMGGRVILLPNSRGNYHNFDELSNLLGSFHRRNPCRGILNLSLNNVNVTGKCSVLKDGDAFRSPECTHVAALKSTTELCNKCAITVRCLRKRVTKPENYTTTSRKLDLAHKKIKRLQSREMIVSLELKTMQAKCRSLFALVQNGSSDDNILKKLPEQ